MTSFETAIGSGVGSEDKTREGPDSGDEHDEAIGGDGSGAKEKGGESKGGDKNGTGRGNEVRAHLMVLSKGRNDSQCLYLSLTLNLKWRHRIVSMYSTNTTNFYVSDKPSSALV